jgi:hypothetical protein
MLGEIVAGASDVAVADMEAGLEADRDGLALLDRSPDAPSVGAIASIADLLAPVLHDEQR